jgi:UDP-N-acetylmuramate dehydrogenase
MGDYDYRSFKLNILPTITDIYFKADCADRTEIFKKIRHNIKIKKSTQPLNTKNAGCFFKNPFAEVKYSSGEMLDMCGLKGFGYGGARVSVKHANFLENYGNASGGDIYILSKIVKDFVKKRFKVDLEYEVKLVGF